MSCKINVLFGDGQELEFVLSDADLAGLDAGAGHDWLGREFEAAGCVPGNPVGKLLVADKIVSLAKAQPRRAFEPPSPWVQQFLRATAAALGRPVVTIDLARHSLGY